MRAVWSFWSKPFLANRGWWRNRLYHLLSWVLSLESARKHYPRTRLVTDDEGARMLVDGAGLEFDQVSTELNSLRDHNPDWWAFGKILAYSLQEEPFVHIDSDVILWKPLPPRLESAPVFVQNPEALDCEDSPYRPELVEHAVRAVNGWLPEELDTYVPLGGVHRAVCCGILGGRRVDFLRHYARRAIDLMDHPLNRPAWPLVGNSLGLSIVFEQYLLAACVAYHQGRKGSPYRDISIEYLFDSVGDAFAHADQIGYTHMIGGAKQDPGLLKKLGRRVQQDYPDLYERCAGCCQTSDQLSVSGHAAGSR